MTTHSDNLTLGRGELWFKTAGEAGFRFLGNAPAFNVNITSDKLDHYRSTRGVREKDKSITISTNRTSTMTLEDISEANLALYLLGSSSVLAQTSATAQTETFTNVTLGHLYQIGMSSTNPTGVRSLTNVALAVGATPLVLNTDYELDAARGTFTLLTTATAVNDLDDVVVTYDRAAKSRKQTVSGANSATGEVKYVAYNAEGNDIDWYMPQVTISPNGEFALLSENTLQSMSLTVEIETKTGYSAIYADGQPY